MNADNDAPLASVVIPTHNRAGLVGRAIQSVLTQTLQDLEIIVVNDGSTDETDAVIAGFRDPRLRGLRHDRARGGGAARNTGIRAARGRWIAFLDDDDRFLPAKLQRQIELADGAAAVVSGFRFLNSGRDKILPIRDITLEHLRRSNPFSGSGILVRTDIARLVEFDESLPRAQDWDFLLRLLPHGRVRYIPEALFEVDHGAHPRITNALRNRDIGEAEARARPAAMKHAQTLGPYWTRYRMAHQVLAYLGSQPDPLARVWRVAGSYGVIPTAHVMLDRLTRRAW